MKKRTFSLIALIALSSQSYAEGDIISPAVESVTKEVVVPSEEALEDNAITWYAGVGFSSVKALCVDGCEDITFGVVGKVGYDFNKYIGVEGRIIKTMWEYEQQKVEHIGIFAKPMLPINEDAHLYALLGYGQAKTGNKIVYDDNGMAWGVGANYYFGDKEEELVELNKQLTVLKTQQEQGEKVEKIQKLQEKIDNFDESKRFGLFVEYERLIQKSDAPNLDAINFGVTFNF